jgi:hypothetical protein
MAHLPVVSRFRGIGTAGAVDTSPRRSHNRPSAGRVRSPERLEHDRLLGAHATGREIASSHGQELKSAHRNPRRLDLRAHVDERRPLPLRRSARLGVLDFEINADLCRCRVRENRLVSVEFTRIGHAVLRRRRRIRKGLSRSVCAGACRP